MAGIRLRPRFDDFAPARLNGIVFFRESLVAPGEPARLVSTITYGRLSKGGVEELTQFPLLVGRPGRSEGALPRDQPERGIDTGNHKGKYDLRLVRRRAAFLPCPICAFLLRSSTS